MSFCRTAKPMLAKANRSQCQWPRGYVVTWSVAPGTLLGPFRRQDLVDIVQGCWASWAALADVRSKYITNADRANIRMRVGQIDGSGSVLAQAQLPCGNVRPTTSLFLEWDASEQWVDAANPRGMMMDINRVTKHELGHSLGLGHAPANSRNLMAPSVSNIRNPSGTWDKQQITSRYGPPVTSPENPDTGNGKRDGFLIAGAYMNDLSVDVYLFDEKVKTISFDDFMKHKAKLMSK